MQRPLKNAYLETLTVSGRENRDNPSGVSGVGSTNRGTTPQAGFPSQIPVADNAGGVKTAEASQNVSREPNKVVGERTVDAELMPEKGSSTTPDATQNTNGWTSVQLGQNLWDAREVGKTSYESERKKYDPNFLYDSGFQSSREQKFGREQRFGRTVETDDVVSVPANDVEVLPKDPPPVPDAGRHDYLTSKNMELERVNLDLLRENERQKFELEAFLRDSVSDPIDHFPNNGPLWHGDSLIEANTRLKTENEMQRYDLQAIQSEMNDMESIIQSIEDRSFAETLKLENLNAELQIENERQKQQLDAYSLQMTNMQNLIQTIRDEAVSLENEKRKLQNDNELLTTKLRGSEGDSERKAFELGNRNDQISDLQNVIENLRSDYASLQNQQDQVIKEKVKLETKFDEAIGEFEKQRFELEAYKKDRSSMESLVHSIRQESEALKDDKKELQDTILNMKLGMDEMTQQLMTSQNKIRMLNAEKEEMDTRNQEANNRLQNQLQESFSKLKQIADEKTEIEMRMQSLENENERQRYEIENSSRDKRALEVMIQSMQNEAEALKNEKATLQATLVGLQQEKQKLEDQLLLSKDEIERLRSEKDAALLQSDEHYNQYQQLQLRFQEVLDELDACQRDGARLRGNLEYDGVNEDFMSRINSRRQNQMRRNQIDEPMDRSWWG